MDLNLLRVLLEIHDAGGVTAACEGLHLSQPAISNALARLRAMLGDELFVRSAQGFVPTAYAERVMPAVREAIATLTEAFEDDPQFDPVRSTRWFRVAMTDAGEQVFVPKLARVMTAQAPGVRIELVQLAFDSLAGVLADGTIDAAIGALPPGPAADLLVQPLFVERYVGLVRRDGMLARAAGARGRLPMAAMRRAPLVLVSQSRTLHRRIDEAVAAEGLEANVVARVPHFIAAPPLVDAYDGLAVMPSELGEHYVARRLGTTVELPLPLAPYEVSLARHRRFERDAGLQWFAERVTDVLAIRAGTPPPAGRSASRRAERA